MTRGEDIDWDLENAPVEIKTDSTLGSNELVILYFKSSQVDDAGGVRIKFSSQPQYYLLFCSHWTNFPKTLPSATEKIWRITLDKSAGIRVIIHCNEERVLNLLLSYRLCANYDFRYYKYWNRDVTKIYFSYSDTASDSYKPSTGNECIIGCIIR